MSAILTPEQVAIIDAFDDLLREIIPAGATYIDVGYHAPSNIKPFVAANVHAGGMVFKQDGDYPDRFADGLEAALQVHRRNFPSDEVRARRAYDSALAALERAKANPHLRLEAGYEA